MKLCIVLLLCCISGYMCQKRHAFDLVSNGYEDVWVAIHESVPEDYNIIVRIKELFREASPVMFTATKERAFFRNVTILVPPTWTNRPEYLPLGNETYLEANVIIEESQVGDSPFTKQTGKCGQPGEYLQLTPRYLTDQAWASSTFGPYGKTLVHEWGHLRWGLFDEYPVDNDPHFYFSWGAIEPVRCSGAIYGQPVDYRTNGRCTINPRTGVYNAECRYQVYDESPEKASLMYLQYLQHVVYFCESAFIDNVNYAHNIDAPNMQNKMCNSRSCWEVMREHEDFKSGNNPPNSNLQTADLEPWFRVVQETQPYRRVLVLDYSTSMIPFINKLKQAVSEFISTTVEDDSWLGIVLFCGTSRTLSPMVKVDATQRQRLVALLHQNLCSATSIGAGLQEALSVLSTHSTTEGGNIIIMTDGQENTPPFISSVNVTLATAGVTVDTIAFSPAAQQNLGNLATDSGGLHFYASSSSGSTALYDAFTASVLLRSRGDNVVAVESESLAINAGATHTGKFVIDSTIGRTTTATFDYSVPSITVELVSPTGDVYNFTSSIYNHSLTLQSIQFALPGIAKTGEWTYTISNNAAGANSLVISVKSRASSGSGTISVKPKLETSYVSYAPGGSVHVYADVMLNGAPVINATVFAEFETPSGAFYLLQLFDNGHGADTRKEDGTYSGYWLSTNMNSNGRYSLRVSVIANGSVEAVLKKAQVSSLAAGTTLTSSTSTTPLGSFQRISAGNSVQVNGYVSPNSSDVHSPDVIRDLRVIETSYDDSTATLAWTATGDDLDRGQAHRYEMRWSENVTELFLFFSMCNVVPITWYIQGHPNITQVSGETENIRLQLPARGDGSPFVFALKAIDEVGNEGGVSNMVSVALLEHKEVNVGLIVGLCMLFVAIIAAVAVGVVLFRNHSQTRTKRVSSS